MAEKNKPPKQEVETVPVKIRLLPTDALALKMEALSKGCTIGEIVSELMHSRVTFTDHDNKESGK